MQHVNALRQLVDYVKSTNFSEEQERCEIKDTGYYTSSVLRETSPFLPFLGNKPRNLERNAVEDTFSGFKERTKSSGITSHIEFF